MGMHTCWCGNHNLESFGPDYGECKTCGTLVSLKVDPAANQLRVKDDETDFYGKQYWLKHQKDDYNYPDIYSRSRSDLIERNLHWIKALLKYLLPPGKVLEMGCAHGSFVALMHHTGFEASGIEMSPWVVEMGRKIFDVPINLGPVESLHLPTDSFDAIVLMDVLEHLPDPVATVNHCLKLLKPEGFLLIQTPEFKQGMQHSSLIESKDPFVEHLKSEEHIYLFSKDSIVNLFQKVGINNIQFETAIFEHYDMFFVASRAPLTVNSQQDYEERLLQIPKGRITLALLDLLADKNYLITQLIASEADREARLKVIENQGRQIGSVQTLETEKQQLAQKLMASEADRAKKLEVIEKQGKQMGRVQTLETENKQLIQKLMASEADRAKKLEVIEKQGRQIGRIQTLETENKHLTQKLIASENNRDKQIEAIKSKSYQLSELRHSRWVKLGFKLGFIKNRKQSK